ncbi:zinc-ribbon domain-containing protein (plasmid) [Coraliomargarita sp. W4R53]
MFHIAVAILDWVTRRDIQYRLFDPSHPYANTFAWMRESLENLSARATPDTARAVWLHLWPAHVALQSAIRGYVGYHAGHPHDFTLPADVTNWYPHPDELQSTRDYLACTGDTNLSALAQRTNDDDPTPTVVNPRTRTMYCRIGHKYVDVVTADDDDGHPATACPACVGFRVKAGVNDLATVAPNTAAQLHPTLNGGLRAAGITARSNSRVWWLCPLDHPYVATPANRTLNDSSCSVCLNRVVLKGVNDLATTHPRIARELHPSSSGKSATQLTASDTKLRSWLCPTGHEYKATVKERVSGKLCRECKKRRTRTSGRSLIDTHPELSNSWLPELNEGREPGDYTRGSKLDVVWLCTKGGHKHTFPMRIEARTRGCDCPYCARRLILEGFSDFATTDPELARDWHKYRNRKYATEVMRGSNYKFHWKCRDGHETEQSIPNRRASGGCVECTWHERPGNRGTNNTLRPRIQRDSAPMKKR